MAARSLKKKSVNLANYLDRLIAPGVVSLGVVITLPMDGYCLRDE